MRSCRSGFELDVSASAARCMAAELRDLFRAPGMGTHTAGSRRDPLCVCVCVFDAAAYTLPGGGGSCKCVGRCCFVRREKHLAHKYSQSPRSSNHVTFRGLGNFWPLAYCIPAATMLHRWHQDVTPAPRGCCTPHPPLPPRCCGPAVECSSCVWAIRALRHITHPDQPHGSPNNGICAPPLGCGAHKSR